ncbi:hypothetical protein [uncultured Rhodoferax sp.]|uniref:hypothetical protein n=1 Tax=uncultured Rhodoferax sp. TaxID=223188 RepID=UPI0025DE7146|nr:hypothetical protein [uncultured Rhodoferax sp.]
MTAFDMNFFDEVKWRAICEKAVADAGAHCGLSDSIYHKELNALIGCQVGLLRKCFRQRAIEIAEKEYDYSDRDDDELGSGQEAGFCSHGLDPDCCPAGCGDIE